MSNDLISRSAVMDYLREQQANVIIEKNKSWFISTDVCDGMNSAINAFINFIVQLPAAYDVDKVVERIKASSTDKDGIVCYVDEKSVITKELAEKIVKSGGIECSNYLKNEDRQQKPADHETKSVPTVQNICEG